MTLEDGTKMDRTVPVEGFFWSDKITVVVATNGKKIRMVEVDPEDSMPDVARDTNRVARAASDIATGEKALGFFSRVERFISRSTCLLGLDYKVLCIRKQGIAW